LIIILSSAEDLAVRPIEEKSGFLNNSGAVLGHAEAGSMIGGGSGVLIELEVIYVNLVSGDSGVGEREDTLRSQLSSEPMDTEVGVGNLFLGSWLSCSVEDGTYRCRSCMWVGELVFLRRVPS